MFDVSQKLTSLFTDIANVLRSKIGINDKIKADDIPSIIEEYFPEDMINEIIMHTVKHIPAEYG